MNIIESQQLATKAKQYLQNNDKKQATEYYIKAINLSNHQPSWVYADLGQLLLEQKKLDDAQYYFELLIQKYPKEISGYVGLAYVANNKEQWEAATKYWHECIYTFPNHKPLQSWLRHYANACFILDNAEQAESICQKFIQLYPNATFPYEKLAKSIEKQENQDKALKYWKLAVKQNPKATWAYSRLWAILAEQIDSSIQDYLNQIQQFPQDASLYISLAGLYCLQKDNIDKAIQYYQMAQKLGVVSYKLYSTLINTLDKLGNDTYKQQIQFQIPHLSPPPPEDISQFLSTLAHYKTQQLTGIDIAPILGLCNRLQAMASALSLAKDTSKKLTIVWVQTPDCSCSFSDLFQPIPSVNIVELKLNVSFRGVYGNKIFKSYINQFYDQSFSRHEMIKLEKDGFDFLSTSQYESIFICAYSAFHQTQPNYSMFKPILACQQQIDVVTQQFNENTIGVHIRRTDNAKSIENSPTHLFIQAMQKELAENPDTLFFLATDDKQEEKVICKVFPNKVLTFAKSTLLRSEAEGIQGALVDLMCLTKTKKIIGSHWSSFSKVAAQIGHIPLYTVLENKQ